VRYIDPRTQLVWSVAAQLFNVMILRPVSDAQHHDASFDDWFFVVSRLLFLSGRARQRGIRSYSHTQAGSSISSMYGWEWRPPTEAHSAVPHRPYRPTASLRDIQPWAIIDALFQLAYETIQCLQAPGLYRLYYYVTVPYQMNCSWRDLAFSHKLSREAYFFLSFSAHCRFLMRHVIRNLTL